VSIEKGEVGGKIVIDYFAPEDLEEILHIIQHDADVQKNPEKLMQRFAEKKQERKERSVQIQPLELSPKHEIKDPRVEDQLEQKLPASYYKVFLVRSESEEELIKDFSI